VSGRWSTVGAYAREQYIEAAQLKRQHGSRQPRFSAWFELNVLEEPARLAQKMMVFVGRVRVIRASSTRNVQFPNLAQFDQFIEHVVDRGATRIWECLVHSLKDLVRTQVHICSCKRVDHGTALRSKPPWPPIQAL